MLANLWKTAFNGGELSPRMSARTDQIKYGSGGSLMQNFLPTVQGPIIRRGGTYFVAPVQNSANRTWLMPFFFNTVNSYMIEIGNQIMRFYTNHGVVTDISATASAISQSTQAVVTANNHGFSNGDQVYPKGIVGPSQMNSQFYKVANATTNTFTLVDIFGVTVSTSAMPPYISGGTFNRIYQITSPYTSSEITDSTGRCLLTFFQSEDVIYIAHPNHPLQVLSRFSNSQWTIANAGLKNGPFQATNNVQANTAYVTPTTTSVSAAVATSAITESISAWAQGASNGAGGFYWRATVTSTSSLVTGMVCNISGVTGTNASTLNGTFTINVVDGTNIDLQQTHYSIKQSPSGGSSVFPSGAIELTVGSTAGINNGNTIEVYGIAGTTEANGVWTVSVIDATHLVLIGSTFVSNYVSGGSIIGRDGTSITITANAPIFSNVGADELFQIQSPISTAGTLNQWEGNISVSAGNRYQSGLNTYIALTSGTSGTNTPIHTQGVQNDGSPGIAWLYEDSGWGCIALSSITSGSVAVGTVQIAPPYICSLPSNQSWLWAHGLSGSVQGYPNNVTVMEDRLTIFQGIQAAGSVSDSYLDFSPLEGGQQTADSGYIITLPVSSPAQWVTPHNDLLVGTMDQEIIITQINAQQALGPTNIRTLKQTAHGSVRVDAVPIEFFNNFVNKSGQQIRQQTYNWMVNGYIANDMTVFGEHLPKGPDGKQGIIQTAWAQDPDYLQWSCTTDGRLICFSFHSEQQVTAWHNHPVGGSDSMAPLAAKGFTNAVVESVRVIPSPDGSCDDLWMIVKRTINGQEMRYVEYLTQYFTDVPQNVAGAFYVDSGLTYIGPSQQKIYGYDHLSGLTLDILLNGAPLNQITVGDDGSITLPYQPVGATMTMQAGLPCWARFIGMRPEGGTQLGTAQTLRKKVSQIAVRLLNSLGFSFGDPQQNGGESTFEAVTLTSAGMKMDMPVQPYTGDKGRPGIDDMVMKAGSVTDGLIEILYNQPVPGTICGMRATVDVAEK